MLFSKAEAEIALLIELILSRLVAGAATPNEAADDEPPAAGKKRLGGAQEGKS